MDPSKLSQASHNIANFINTNINPDDRIKDIKKALSTLSTTVQNKLVLQPKNETSKGEALTKTPSLKSLFSSNLSTILNDSKETVSQNYIAKEISKAFNNVFPTKNQTKSNDNENCPTLNSRDTRASPADLDKFDKSLSNSNGVKGLIASYFKISNKEINSKIAEGVRDRYKEHQKTNGDYSIESGKLNVAIDELKLAIKELDSSQNLEKKELDQLKSLVVQLKSLQLEKHIRSLSPEDQQKFLSLKPQEVKALQLYTADDGYRYINYKLDGNIRNKETFVSDKPQLRRGDEAPTHLAKTDEAAELATELIASALNKLPGYGHTVYKSVKMTAEQVESYRKVDLKNGENKFMLSNKFFSTTKSLEEAERFDKMSSKQLEDGTPLRKVIYQIEPPSGGKLTGADITYLSAKDGEEEVLFNHGTIFKFAGIEEVPETVDKNGVTQEAYAIIKFNEKQNPSST